MIGFLLFYWLLTPFVLVDEPLEADLSFEVVLHDKVVGVLNATRKKDGSTTIYGNDSRIETRVLIKVVVSYDFEVMYSDAHMVSSKATLLYNNKIHAQTEVDLVSNKYHVERYHSGETYIDERITYTSGMLMFEEPVGVTSLFAEIPGEMQTIEPVGDHSYKKTDSDGHVNHYHYQDGNLVKAEIDGGLIKFDLRRK